MNQEEHRGRRIQQMERRLDKATERLNAAERKILGTEIQSIKDISEERWKAHMAAHVELAASLKEYKAVANEWRSTLSDFRADFLGLPEWKSEHNNVLLRLTNLERLSLTAAEYQTNHGLLVGRVDNLEKRADINDTERNTTRNVFTNGRNLLLLAIAIVGAISVIMEIATRLGWFGGN